VSKIIVALPAYNEEKYVGSTILQVRKYVDKVIVVDDGSTDDTIGVATLAGAEIVCHEHNKGYGATIQTILDTVKPRNVDCLVIMDADYQHHAKDIPSIIAPVLSGSADMVIGQRRPESIPRYRKTGQAVLSMFTRIVSRSQVRDTQSGFRAYSPRAINALTLRQSGMAVSSEITAAATKAGLKVTEVPVHVRYDGDGSTHNPVTQGIHTLTRVLSMISEQRPLLFFESIGGLLLVIGFTVGLRSYNMLIATGLPPTGTMLLSSLFIMAGLLSCSTGVILYTIVKVLDK